MAKSSAHSFPHTRWSVVRRLRAPAEAERCRAMSELCVHYWRPLYTYARRCGHSREDAEDLTQGFLARMVEREDIGDASEERGRLRVLFKAAFRNFVTDQIRHASREKRGGKPEMLSLDVASAERQFEKSFSQSTTPEEAFDRHWAHTILQLALTELRKRFAARGRDKILRTLEVYLGAEGTGPPHADAARSLGLSENAVAAAVHRLREEFRDILRAEVADTLAESEDVEEELRYLLRALG
jgi:RNA polymerase sigma factor (sigma-70 family)